MVGGVSASAVEHPSSGVEAPAGRGANEQLSAVDLFWLPLGAGGHSVRINGRVFEALSALSQHRERRDLYHSALEVRLGDQRYVIEMAPVWNERAKERGVVAEGTVGDRHLVRLRLFRYEIRCWLDGRIPDVDEAVDSPVPLTTDTECARRVLELARQVPTPVWGRDEFHAGEMWNSNSVVSWLITRSEIAVPTDSGELPIRPPAGGRAPGWDAGVVIARRQTASEPTPRTLAAT